MSCLSYTGGTLLLLPQDRPDATLLGKAISQADRFLRYSFEVFTAAMVIKVFYGAAYVGSSNLLIEVRECFFLPLPVVVVVTFLGKPRLILLFASRAS